MECPRRNSGTPGCAFLANVMTVPRSPTAFAQPSSAAKNSSCAMSGWSSRVRDDRPRRSRIPAPPRRRLAPRRRHHAQPGPCANISTPTGSSPGHQPRVYGGCLSKAGITRTVGSFVTRDTHPGPLHTAGFLLKPATAAGWPQWPAGSQHPRLLRRQPSRHAPGCGSRRPAPRVGFLHRRSQEC